MDQLYNASATQQGIACVEYVAEMDLNLLSWLKGQTIYPQCYLHFRDSPTIFATIGKVRSFLSLDLAQAFIQQTTYPLVGGVQFYGECQFILPRLLLLQQENKLKIQLFIDNNQPF